MEKTKTYSLQCAKNDNVILQTQNRSQGQYNVEIDKTGQAK